MAKGMSFKVLMQLQTKEFQKGIKNIQRQLNGFKNFMKSAFALGSVTMFGREMIRVGKDFENAMARVQAVSNATTEEFKKMQAEAQRLGSTTRYTATEAAEALENLTRNGMTAANATKALSGVLQLAQANSIGLADAANIVTNTLNMFNLSVKETNRVNDVLSSTASHAATDISLLYEAMVNAAPAANVLGFSIEEVSSAIGALAQRGVKGAEAGTKLRIAFQKMADPKVIAKMRDYGIEVDENTMKTEGLRKTVEKIAKANLSLGQLGKIFDAKSAMAVQQLVASLDDLDTLLEVTANSAGETSRMFNQSVGSVQQELDSLKSMYEGLLISISQKTSGVVKSVVRLLQNLITNFETVSGTIMNIASVAVPLLSKRVIQLATTMRTAFTQIAAGATTVKAALGGWVSIIATLVTWVGTALVGAWNRAHKAMRDANKQMADAQEESARLALEVDALKKEIGDGSDKNTLNGAVQRAIELFPDFAEAINDARRIAEKTGEWERLKQILQDIADLQASVLYADAAKAAHEAELDAFGKQMTKGTGWWGRNIFGGIDVEGRALFREIDRQLNERKMGDRKDEVANLIARNIEDNFGDYGGTVKAIARTLDIWRLDYTFKEIEGLLQNYVYKTESFTKEDNEDRPYRGKMATTAGTEFEPVIKSLNEYNAADSANVARAVELAEKILNDGLNTITKNDKASNEERYTLHQHYLDAILKAGLKEGSERVKNEREWLKEHSKWAPKTNTPGDSGGSGGSGSGSKGKIEKADKDYISDAIKNYDENVSKLNNRLAAGTITQKEYETELNNLVDKTWEAITAFSNFSDILANLGKKDLGNELAEKYKQNRFKERTDAVQGQLTALGDYSAPKKQERDTRRDYLKSDTEKKEEEVRIAFDYAESLDKLVKDFEAAIDKGEFSLVKEDAIADLENLKEKAKEAAAEAETLQAKLDLSEAITKIDEQIKNLQVSAMETFETFSQAMDRVLNGLMGIAEIFDEDLKDSPFFQGMQAFMSALDSSTQIIQAFIAISDFMTKMDKKQALEKVKNAAVEVASNKAVEKSELEKAGAETADAAAGAASSVANIPWVGPALAVAAVAAVLAAIAAAGKNKFANGGIVGGTSYSGDHNIIRANSGELVLNKHQQASLWNMINGKGGAGVGNVQFIIRGTDLVGVLNNYNRVVNP